MSAVVVELQDRPADAQHRYEQIVATSPDAVVATNNLAWLYAERGGNLDVALGLAQTAFQLNPNLPEISDTLGWVYYKKGLLPQATSALQRSVEGDPSSPVYHYHLGLIHTKRGDRLKARQSLEKALALDSNFDGSSDARRVLTSLRD
jgi:tetratricopeptide (TPR) repeat protein